MLAKYLCSVVEHAGLGECKASIAQHFYSYTFTTFNQLLQHETSWLCIKENKSYSNFTCERYNCIDLFLINCNSFQSTQPPIQTVFELNHFCSLPA